VLQGPALVPEKWGVVIAESSHVTEKSIAHTSETFDAIKRASINQLDKTEVLLESFLTLQQIISNRDSEIARLKKGHDAKIFKRFVARFIKVSLALEEIYEEEKDSEQAKNYKYLCRLIQSALEECGIEQMIPEINSDFRQLGAEVDDDPDFIETDDESLDFTIATVESPGYVIEGEGDREIFIPAKVKIFRKTENETGDKL